MPKRCAPQPEPREPLHVPFGGTRVLDAVGAVDLPRDRLDLLLDRQLQRIEGSEPASDRRLQDPVGEIEASLAALRVDPRPRDRHTALPAERLDPRQLVLGVHSELVDRHHARDAESGQDVEVGRQIGQTALEGPQIGIGRRVAGFVAYAPVKTPSPTVSSPAPPLRSPRHSALPLRVVMS